MPANYQLGKIYGIFAPSIFKVYIGSTYRSLASRLYKHKKRNSQCTSKQLMKCIDMKIVLIENFPCNSRKELERREGEWIKSLEGSGMCVNKNVAGRTRKEYQQSNRGKERNKKYRKVYNQSDKCKESSRKSDEKRKDIRKQRHDCDCGGKYTHRHKSTHMKSKKHLAHGQKVIVCETVEVSSVHETVQASS